MILNRLKFVEMERERNLKTAAWAQRKYSLMVERRTYNLHMKETLSQVHHLLTQERSVLERENVEHVRKLKEKSIAEREER